MEVPIRATLLLMTYPLSMDSVKVHLELLPLGYLDFLYTSRTMETFFPSTRPFFKYVQLFIVQERLKS